MNKGTRRARSFRRMFARAATGLCAMTLAACNTTGMMEVPKPSPVSYDRPLTPVSTTDGLFDTDRRQATFALMRVVGNLRRGQVIAHFPGFGNDIGTEGTLCNKTHRGNSTLEWGSGATEFGNWSTELGTVFFDTLTAEGLKVAGDPHSLFEIAEEVGHVEYHVGAVIEDVAANFCENHHWWSGRPLKEHSGEMYIKVRWVIYDTLAKREVAKVETEAYYQQKKAKRNGVTMALHGAFSEAAARFARSPRFRDIIFRKSTREAVVASVDAESLGFRSTPLSSQPIKTRIDNVIESVVTLVVGGGHGSGFVISEDGLILTNAHVVGGGDRITARFANGVEVIGEVLRRHKLRDVALVKVPIRVKAPLPIARHPARVLDTVYAIGAPKDEGLHSSVTRGVVSALRRDSRTGLTQIQADVPISSGNSGGPLLDEYGNVIGITVATHADERAQNINFFIPIEDALAKLNLTVSRRN